MFTIPRDTHTSNMLLNDTEGSEISGEKGATCKFYMKGNCKHGRKGANCKYNHPKPCKKLMQHGNKGTRGCKEGKNCLSFHPRMCADSIRRGECFDNKCAFVHVKGTTRKKKDCTKVEGDSNKEEVHKIPKMNKGNGQTGDTSEEVLFNAHPTDGHDFLDMIHNFKVEIMNAMDSKINTMVMSLMTPKTNFQTSTMFPVRPTETNVAMPMPWMGIQQHNPSQQFLPQMRY